MHAGKVAHGRIELFNIIFQYHVDEEYASFLDYDLYYEMLIKCFPKISLVLIK